MKNKKYFVLLVAELFVDSVLMISLRDSSLYIPPAVFVAELIAEEYGAKVIGCKYSEPIENSFN